MIHSKQHSAPVLTFEPGKSVYPHFYFTVRNIFDPVFFLFFIPHIVCPHSCSSSLRFGFCSTMDWNAIKYTNRTLSFQSLLHRYANEGPLQPLSSSITTPMHQVTLCSHCKTPCTQSTLIWSVCTQRVGSNRSLLGQGWNSAHSFLSLYKRSVSQEKV